VTKGLHATIAVSSGDGIPQHYPDSQVSLCSNQENGDRIIKQ